MLSKVKDLMDVGSKLEEMSKKVKSATADVSAQAKEMSHFKSEISALKGEVSKLVSESSKFCSSVQSQISELKSATDELKNEVYDFKMIKADIKSKLVSELGEAFREELKKETKTLDMDVKNFNALKDELSSLVGKFKSVESDIMKFKEISQVIKSTDFELSKYAHEVTKADHEKLELMQKIDQLENLLSKLRRQGR